MIKKLVNMNMIINWLVAIMIMIIMIFLITLMIIMVMTK